jgi:RNA polymerase sigma factor (sigma-70 family)
MRNISEPEIIEGIRNSDEEILRYTYKHFFPVIRHMVTGNNGSHGDAREVFQETLVVVFDKLRKNKGELDCSLKTFIYSVGRNLWLQELEKSRKQIPFHEIEHLLAEEERVNYDDVIQSERRIFQRHFVRLTEKCQQLIQLFLSQKTYDEISEIMGFKSRHAAIKRKHECVKSLFKRIQDDPEYKEL